MPLGYFNPQKMTSTSVAQEQSLDTPAQYSPSDHDLPRSSMRSKFRDCLRVIAAFFLFFNVWYVSYFYKFCVPTHSNPNTYIPGGLILHLDPFKVSMLSHISHIQQRQLYLGLVQFKHGF